MTFMFTHPKESHNKAISLGRSASLRVGELRRWVDKFITCHK